MFGKIISFKVEFSKEECYCSIQSFYDLIANQFGYDLERVKYNCEKICVTKQVRKQIFAYYKIENNLPEDNVIKNWLLFGPKSNLPYDAFIAEVQNGFIEPSIPCIPYADFLNKRFGRVI